MVIVPAVSLTRPFHRSRNVYREARGSPAASVLVRMVSGAEPRLSKAIARSPFASGLTQTSPLPCCEIRVPCTPSRSWSIARTSRFVSMLIVAGDSARTSLPTINGAATIDHMVNCAWAWAAVMPSSGPR